MSASYRGFPPSHPTAPDQKEMFALSAKDTIDPCNLRRITETGQNIMGNRNVTHVFRLVRMGQTGFGTKPGYVWA